MKEGAGIPKSAHYRPSESDSKCCGKCKWFTETGDPDNDGDQDGKCRMWTPNPDVDADHICDHFQRRGGRYGK